MRGLAASRRAGVEEDPETRLPVSRGPEAWRWAAGDPECLSAQGWAGDLSVGDGNPKHLPADEDLRAALTWCQGPARGAHGGPGS